MGGVPTAREEEDTGNGSKDPEHLHVGLGPGEAVGLARTIAITELTQHGRASTWHSDAETSGGPQHPGEVSLGPLVLPGGDVDQCHALLGVVQRPHPRPVLCACTEEELAEQGLEVQELLHRAARAAEEDAVLLIGPCLLAMVRLAELRDDEVPRVLEERERGLRHDVDAALQLLTGALWPGGDHKRHLGRNGERLLGPADHKEADVVQEGAPLRWSTGGSRSAVGAFGFISKCLSLRHE
mmetsp:Transcript_1242/g.3516  ORF Transcript_1242/g.3516 Transcript_1242/m.3516 type:complete len:240 (+) Transcript_1242:1468-2187(+)